MNIPELIKKSHDNAVQKGFYPEGEQKNIGELLMLIVSELGEALEAHRKNKFADIAIYEKYVESVWPDFSIPKFETFIKDTFEDELADVCIRLFDLCGYLDIQPIDFPHGVTIDNNVGEFLLTITHMVCLLKESLEEDYKNESMYEVIHYIKVFCEIHNIDLEKHIELKMKYNETREYKHGKNY